MDSRIMTALGDRVLTLGPKPASDSPYKNFKLTRDADGVAWLLFDRADASANTLSSDVMEEFDTVLAAIETERPARARDPLRKIVRLHCRRRRQRIPRRRRSRNGGDTDPRRACGGRSSGGAEAADRRGHPWFLSRRRARGRARLPIAYRHRRRALRLSGGDARPSSWSRRHSAFHRAGQFGPVDGVDADGPHHRRAPRQIARPRRHRDAGAPCQQCGEGCAVWPVEAGAPGYSHPRRQFRTGCGGSLPGACAAKLRRLRPASTIPRLTR
ncbi:hypothetical protein ACVWW2_002683 [Bradyrhizobium sp. LM4.3]